MNPPAWVFIVAYTSLAWFLIFGFAYAAWNELDKKRHWFLAFNTNTGTPHVFRRKPGHEGITYQQRGKDKVFVKLESNMMWGRDARGPVWVFDADTGMPKKPLPAAEGEYEGLDGKVWAKFLVANLEERATSAAGGKLEQWIKYAVIGLAILAIPVTLIALKVFGAIGGP